MGKLSDDEVEEVFKEIEDVGSMRARLERMKKIIKPNQEFFMRRELTSSIESLLKIELHLNDVAYRKYRW